MCRKVSDSLATVFGTDKKDLFLFGTVKCSIKRSTLRFYRDPRYEEEEPAEGYPKRDDNARTYREDDPNENAGRNSPRTTVRQPLVPPNKPTFVPDDNEV